MIYHKGSLQIDQCAHRLMEFYISPDCHGNTVVGDYITFYHEERLYTVRHLKKGISCMVYARSPYDAIEKVLAIDAADVMEDLSDVRPVVLCRDCKYAPSRTDDGEDQGFALEWPHDEWPEYNPCPFKCADGWYSHKPAPDFFCAAGEKKEENNAE